MSSSLNTIHLNLYCGSATDNTLTLFVINVRTRIVELKTLTSQSVSPGHGSRSSNPDREPFHLYNQQTPRVWRYLLHLQGKMCLNENWYVVWQQLDKLVNGRQIAICILSTFKDITNNVEHFFHCWHMYKIPFNDIKLTTKVKTLPNSKCSYQSNIK